MAREELSTLIPWDRDDAEIKLVLLPLQWVQLGLLLLLFFLPTVLELVHWTPGWPRSSLGSGRLYHSVSPRALGLQLVQGHVRVHSWNQGLYACCLKHVWWHSSRVPWFWVLMTEPKPNGYRVGSKSAVGMVFMESAAWV